MNKKNIVELAEQIRQVGFEDVLGDLVRRLCFKPIQFVLTRTMRKGNDQLTIDFRFERISEECYAVKYYDAVLQKKTSIDRIIDSVDIKLLDKRMAEIRWREVFNLESPGPAVRAMNEEETWAEAEAIEVVISDLLQLEVAGAYDVALTLKKKYWSGTLYQEFTGASLPIRLNSSISQRFFIHEEQIISYEEAYRFLQNRWMEKELHMKQKANGNHGDLKSDGMESGNQPNGSPKRRKMKRKTGKRNK